MKLSHLSLAVLTAIALTACGGSDKEVVTPGGGGTPGVVPGGNGNNNQPDDSLPVDGNGLADAGLPASEAPKDKDWDSVASTNNQQYIRESNSEFNYLTSPNEENDSVLTVTGKLPLDPRLQNFIGGYEKGTFDDSIKDEDFAGKDFFVVNYFGKYYSNEIADQEENRLNIRNFNLSGSPKTDKYYDVSMDPSGANPANVDANPRILSVDKKFNFIIGGPTFAYTKYNGTAVPPVPASFVGNYEVTQFITLPDDTQSINLDNSANTTNWYKVGNDRHPVADGTKFNDVTIDGGINGLVAYNYYNPGFTYDNLEDSKQGITDGEKLILETQGRDRALYEDPATHEMKVGTQTQTSTRVLGYLSRFELTSAGLPDPAEHYNSYEGVEKKPVVLAGKGTGKSALALRVKEQKLSHVQFGRVTGDMGYDETRIGILATDPKTIGNYVEVDGANDQRVHPREKNIFKMHRGFMNNTAPASTSYYFARGVGETTLDQMKALKQDVITYKGTALTYGVDGRWHGGMKVSTDNLPNAFGSPVQVSDNSIGLGDFVLAKFDVAKQNVEGFIYNSWIRDFTDLKNKKIVNNKLIDFEGKVHGNSVIGSAKLSYVTDGVEGKFRGTFYGDSATELGGAVNAITLKNSDEKSGYAPSTWGAVFGAKRVGGANAYTTEVKITQ